MTKTPLDKLTIYQMNFHDLHDYLKTSAITNGDKESVLEHAFILCIERFVLQMSMFWSQRPFSRHHAEVKSVCGN